MLITNFI